MPDNEFIDGLGEVFESGESDPYIQPDSARDAIREDFPQWEDAIADGLADYESAALMASFGVDDPYDISGISLNYDGDNWEMSVQGSDATYEIDLGGDLPFWVWDWLYDMADAFDWDWEIGYE